jgi:HD-GYP domain-containing protein (c-di-GMP phosphodiesterase class II)
VTGVDEPEHKTLEGVEFRILVQGLRKGMFVSRLDRPWIETPFPLEGIAIRSQGDIDRLVRYCTHVYVDIERGARPDMKYVDPLSSEASSQPVWLAELRTTFYDESVSLEAEMPQAREVYEEFAHALQDMYGELQDGGNLDLGVVKNGMRSMIDSVLRNPNACGWLARFKDSDDSLYRHALGCAVWSAALGRHLGLGRNELDDLVLGCILMDAGKSRLPRELLARKERYNDEECLQVKTHVTLGLDLIDTGAVSERVVEIVCHHHERHDGQGYLQGLAGNAIPLFARIAALVDCYDALINVRPHRPPHAPHEAISMLYRSRGRRYQPELVEQFIQAIGIYPSGTLVELSSGEVAVVVSLNGARRLKPKIMLLLDQDKQPYSDFATLDLLDDPLSDDGRIVSIRRGLPPGAFGIRAEELYL